MKSFIAYILLICLPVISQQTNPGPGCRLSIFVSQIGISTVNSTGSLIDMDLTTWPGPGFIDLVYEGQPGSTMYIGIVPGGFSPGAYRGCYGILDIDPLNPYFVCYTAIITSNSQVTTSDGAVSTRLITYQASTTFDFTIQGYLVGDSIYNPVCGTCSTIAIHIHR